MYQRYTSRSGGGMQSAGNVMMARVRNIIMLLLVIAVILLAVFGGRAISYQSESHIIYIRRLQTECNDALALAPSLSRTAGASSAATLSKIRSCVHSMDVINQMNMSLEGGYLVDSGVFTNLYGIIDDYYNRLTTGMVTSDQQTELTNVLTQLVQTLSYLE